MSIVIFTNPIRTGKTTQLLHWCEQQQNVGGIVMPDINGIRHVLDIQTKEIFIIECDDPGNTNEPLVNIGRFYFYAAAFEKANAILINESTKARDWLVIDEVGRLEVDGKGFYPSIKKILDTKNYKNLLLVVRDSLYEKAVSFFMIPDHIVIHRLDQMKLM